MAGAVFAEVGEWLLLLRALYWTFHVKQGSITQVMSRGRRNIYPGRGVINEMGGLKPFNISECPSFLGQKKTSTLLRPLGFYYWEVLACKWT